MSDDYMAECYYQSDLNEIALQILNDATDDAGIINFPSADWDNAEADDNDTYLPPQAYYDYKRKGEPQRVYRHQSGHEDGDCVDIDADQQPCILCDGRSYNAPGDLYIGRRYSMYHEKWIVFKGYLCEQCSENDEFDIRLK